MISFILRDIKLEFDNIEIVFGENIKDKWSTRCFFCSSEGDDSQVVLVLRNVYFHCGNHSSSSFTDHKNNSIIKVNYSRLKT